MDLVCKGKLGSLLMQLGELVIVLEDLLKGGLYELFLPFTDGDGEIVDLELELVVKGKLGSLLLQLGELVLVAGLDKLVLQVTDSDGELVDLEVAEV